jgi:apolipoprotein D and lipocalin family protein
MTNTPHARRAPGAAVTAVAVLLLSLLWLASSPVRAAQDGAPHGRVSPVQTVPSVDLDRYLGTWYELARLPNRFQEDCVGDVRATYSRREDGRIDVLNQCREADGATNDAKGVARIVDRRTNAKLEVRFAPALLSFIPAVWGDYWILGLDDDYRWAAVGSPDRKYLWILARKPDVAEATFTAAVDAARRNGFAVERLVRTSHTGAAGR